MKGSLFTQKERIVIYGLFKYPNLSDKELSERLKIKSSTVTSIKNRLKKDGYFKTLILPSLQNMGCELLVLTYTNFTPLIPLEERLEITTKNIEIFEEIFLSVAQQDKGFSLSFSKEYTTIGKINDIRTEIFGKRGLLEGDYPNMVIFPLKTSKIYRFFDFAPLIKENFGLEYGDEDQSLALRWEKDLEIKDKERNILCAMVCYPEFSDEGIARIMGLSRPTVSRYRRYFIENNLIRKINIPDLKKFGFEILALYHILFDPRNPPDKDNAVALMSNKSIFFASRQFEAAMISVYHSYDDFNSDYLNLLHLLKKNKWISIPPRVLTYSLSKIVFIKDFKFAPITQKIVGCDPWVKKLLNM